jgi:hypothetical protein
MEADLGGSWRLNLTASMAHPQIFTLKITGPNPFASGTHEIKMRYDKGSQLLIGSAASNSISIPLDATTFPSFLHGFTAGNSMFVEEGSSETKKVNLTGTSAAISKLGQCTEAANFTQLPLPWHAPTSTEVVAATAGANIVGDSQTSTDTKSLDRYKIAPLATGAFLGKPLTLLYKDLSILVDQEASNDGSVCSDLDKGALGFQPENSPPSTPCNAIFLTISQKDQAEFKAPLFLLDNQVDIGSLGLRVDIRHLAADIEEPEVVLSAYTGGAHCCTITAAFADTQPGSWTNVPLGGTDSDSGFDYVALLGDESTQIVDTDDRFEYRFSSYAGSYSPTRIRILDGENAQDVTRDPRFREFLMQKLELMQNFYKKSDQGEPNGYLAGWVAQKALVGQLNDAWQTMLASYDHSSVNGLSQCMVDKSVWVPGAYKGEGPVCPPEEETNISFPQALALQLIDWGYMTAAQSAALGFDPAAQQHNMQTATVAYVQQKRNAWYLETNSGDCVAANTPSSPAELITMDRSNGIEDNVDIVQSDGSKPIVVKVAEPERGDLEEVFTFYRGEGACETARQNKQYQLNQLQ